MLGMISRFVWFKKLWVAKLVFRNTILGNLVNRGTKTKAIKIYKKQHPARPPPTRRPPGAVFYWFCMLFDSFSSTITQNR